MSEQLEFLVEQRNREPKAIAKTIVGIESGTDPVKMLFRYVEAIMNMTHVNFRDAVLQLRDFQAYFQFGKTMDIELPKWDEKVTERVTKLYKPELLLSDIDDWWGKLIDYGAQKKYSFLNNKLGQFFTPIGVVDAINSMVSNQVEKQEVEKVGDLRKSKPMQEVCTEYAKMVAMSDNVKTVLDPCCGTGCFIIRFFKKVVGTQQPYVFYNAEIDIELYRIALMQMAFYQIPGVCLWADSLTVDLNDEKNWQKYGNLWNPPHWSERKEELKPLAHAMNLST